MKADLRDMAHEITSCNSRENGLFHSAQTLIDGDSPSKVEKRPARPCAESFAEKGKNCSIVWGAKHMGGEKRKPPKLTLEMERQYNS
jgi:hypothetical protein